MLNTPKSTPRLSFTRSLPRISEQAEPAHSKVIHGSLEKCERINYNIILNKLLALPNYQKFILLASKFVDKSILQCKQRPNRLSNSKSLQSHLISDGLFVRKLADLSQNPLAVINHFMSLINRNKKYLKELEKKFTKQTNETQSQLEDEYQSIYYKNETEQEREQRLSGIYIPKESENIKQIKIVYSEYIKTNRKSMEIFNKVKQKLQKEGKPAEKYIQPAYNLKRFSTKQNPEIQTIAIEELKPSNRNKLSQVEKQVFKFFPQIRYIAHKSQQIKEWKIIDFLGCCKSHSVYKVGIQLEDGFQYDLGLVNYKTKFNFPTIEHAILIEPTPADEVQRVKQKCIEQDEFIRIYLTN